MSDRWQYISGELVQPGITTRVYRRGRIGKVVRTRMTITHVGESKTRYFVWSRPDSSPEYETEAEAIAEAHRDE